MANMLNRFSNIDLGHRDQEVDISHVIAPHGDFGRTRNLNVILNSWLNILTTPKDTSDHDPEYGCGIQKFLFKQSDSFTLDEIKEEILYSLTKYDNRAKITNINVNLLRDLKGIKISIFVEYNGEKGQLSFTSNGNSFIIHNNVTSG